MPELNNQRKPMAGDAASRIMEIGAVRGEGEGTNAWITMSFSSETPYRRWYGTEILSHAPGAVDFTRLRSVGVVLYAHGHDGNVGRMPIAKITDVRLEADNVCRADIEFDSEDEFAEKVKRKVADGFIRGVSVGYRVIEWEYLAKKGQKSTDGRFTAEEDETYIAVKWEPYEISIEPVPADHTVGVGRAIENTQNKGEVNMGENEKTTTVAPQVPQNANPAQRGAEQPAAPAAAPTAGEGNAVSAERARAAEITTLCRTFGMDASEHIESGATVDRVRAAILENLAQQNQTSGVRVTNDEGDRLRDAVSDALLIRTGAHLDEPRMSAARNFRAMRLRAIADECLLRAGVQNPQYMDDSEAFARALSPDTAFAAILDATVQKSLAREYASVQTTFEAFTSEGSLADFKAAKIYSISEAGDLKRIKPGAEFEFDEMKDTAATAQLATYGRSWGFNREAMINDDLSALSRVPAAYVRAYKRAINKLVYKALTSIQYSAEKGNLSAEGAISVASVGDMRALMRKQKNLRGKETLNIEGKKLIVPAELEVAALELIGSTANPAAPNSGTMNVFRNSLDAVIDAELDTYSAKAYYLAADPRDVEGIRVSYLNGKKEPHLESRPAWDRLGVEWRIYGDVGVDTVDPCAFVKNPG